MAWLSALKYEHCAEREQTVESKTNYLSNLSCPRTSLSVSLTHTCYTSISTPRVIQHNLCHPICHSLTFHTPLIRVSQQQRLVHTGQLAPVLSPSRSICMSHCTSFQCSPCFLPTGLCITLSSAVSSGPPHLLLVTLALHVTHFPICVLLQIFSGALSQALFVVLGYSHFLNLSTFIMRNDQDCNTFLYF